MSHTWCAWGLLQIHLSRPTHISPPIHHHMVIFISLLISFPSLPQVVYLLFLFVYIVHRLTYSHSWASPTNAYEYECMWKYMFFFSQANEEMHPCLLLHPMRDAYILSSQYILFPTWKLGFRLKTLISIETLMNVDHISSSRPISSHPFARPPTSCSRLANQGFLVKP